MFSKFLMALPSSVVVGVSLSLSAGGRSVGRSVGGRGGRGRHSGKGAEPLEAQRAADGGRQDHAQDDAADDDHDLLLQREDRQTDRASGKATDTLHQPLPLYLQPGGGSRDPGPPWSQAPPPAPPVGPQNSSQNSSQIIFKLKQETIPLFPDHFHGCFSRESVT